MKGFLRPILPGIPARVLTGRCPPAYAPRNMKSHKQWLAAPIASFLLALSPAAVAEMKLAVVDTQRAVMETEDGLRAQATLQKHFDKRQRELDDKQTQL